MFEFSNNRFVQERFTVLNSLFRFPAQVRAGYSVLKFEGNEFQNFGKAG